MQMLAFVEMTTTGPEPKKHELLEVALVRVSPKNLEPLSEMSFRVRPEHLERARPKALAAAGYDPAEWHDALPLREAMRQLTPMLENAILAGHQVAATRRFLDEAWERSAVKPARLALHTLDTLELARPLFLVGRVKSLSLETLTRRLSYGERLRGALYDARRSAALARSLLTAMGDAARWGDDVLGGDDDLDEEDDLREEAS